MERDFLETHCTAFYRERIIAQGTLEHVVSIVLGAIDPNELSHVLVFKDASSEQIEVDFRGSVASVLERLANHPDSHPVVSPSETGNLRSPGRPKLGVVAGEVTLLPRHWEWLKSQPGGASVTLRKLVDEARRTLDNKSTLQRSKEKVYRFMTVMAGDRDHYEDALRALYAGDASRFRELIADWPTDIRNYTIKLAQDCI